MDAQRVASAGRSLCWNPASPAWPAWGRGTAPTGRYQYEQYRYLAENPTESLRTAYRGWLAVSHQTGSFFFTTQGGQYPVCRRRYDFISESLFEPLELFLTETHSLLTAHYHCQPCLCCLAVQAQVMVIPGRSLAVPEYHSTACLQRTSLGTLLLLVHRNLLRLSR